MGELEQLRHENQRLRDENQKLRQSRDDLVVQLDAITEALRNKTL